MHDVLDNTIWNAITTGNRDLAMVNGSVGCYDPKIAPFAGMKERSTENFERLYDLLGSGRRVAVSYEERIILDGKKWKPLRQMDCYQMVYDNPFASFTTAASSLITPLNIEHIPEMVELTKLTKPGPFFENTILFGNYFGIFVDGRLAAITGQRMHPVPYMEVSAVCTHPDFRGKGYAKALMLHVMKIILDNSFIPFLHVLTSNEPAIQLYESIGFRIRKKLFIDGIERL